MAAKIPLKAKPPVIPAMDSLHAISAKTAPCSEGPAKRDTMLRQITIVRLWSQPRHIPVTKKLVVSACMPARAYASGVGVKTPIVW